jgi:two-component sensor histidine kinase
LITEIENTYATHQPAQVNLALDSVQLNLEKAIPAALIVYELVSNSFKHTLSHHLNPALDITMRQTDHSVSITTADNGEGLPENFSLDNTSTLGLELVNALTQQLSGSIDYEYSDGAQFTLHFPLS